MKKFLVTGGTGFVGSALVKRLLQDGHKVRVLDDNSRGADRRLNDVKGDFEMVLGDIRDSSVVDKAMRGIDAIHHLAYINGTKYFYEVPELVLEIAVKGMINTLDSAIKHHVREIYLASSSEVYHHALKIPTDESVPLVIPDIKNPRFSYGGGKIICELLAVNYGRKFFDRVCIYRPHNVYGVDMGWEHVIPQFSLRLKELSAKYPLGKIKFHLQGSGDETRSFCHIRDFIDGVILLQDKGEHLNVYNIGTLEEISVSHLASVIASSLGKELDIIPGEILDGSTPRRCPDITKMFALGYSPQIDLRSGVPDVAHWYWQSSRPSFS